MTHAITWPEGQICSYSQILKVIPKWHDSSYSLLKSLDSSQLYHISWFSHPKPLFRFWVIALKYFKRFQRPWPINCLSIPQTVMSLYYVPVVIILRNLHKYDITLTLENRTESSLISCDICFGTIGKGKLTLLEWPQSSEVKEFIITWILMSCLFGMFPPRPQSWGKESLPLISQRVFKEHLKESFHFPTSPLYPLVITISFMFCHWQAKTLHHWCNIGWRGFLSHS